MFNWLLDKLTDHWEKKCQRRMGGIPMCWVIYHPDRPIPNIDFRLHPQFTDDEWLHDTFRDVAYYMRDNYLEVKED